MGELKTLNVKNYCEQELYKKCGFKKDTNFVLQTTWNVNLNDRNYSISMYGKTDGKKNFENISIFPYPINNKTFYGSCALVASSDGTNVSLSINLWNQLNEKIIENQNSCSFINTTQTDIKVKSNKKEKQKKKENDKEKEEREIDEINSSTFQELEEEEYCYSSDEDKK